MHVRSRHFAQDDYNLPGYESKRKVLKKTAVPSQNLPNSTHDAVKAARCEQLSAERKQRMQRSTSGRHTSTATSCSSEILDRPLVTTAGTCAVQKKGGLEHQVRAQVLPACVTSEPPHPTTSVASHATERQRNFVGLVLRWPDSASSEMSQRMPRLLGLLRNRLMAQHGLNLGLALRQDTVGPGSPLLANNFSLASVYLLPPGVTASSYAKYTFRYFTDDTLAKMRQLYQHASSSGAKKAVCYLFPADTYTFTVAREDSPLATHEVPSLGPGIQGPVTRLPGRMAHFETCHPVQSYERRERTYDVLATLNGSLLSYTTHTLLRHFLDELHQNVSDTCLGIWNPHWDDFANVCGYERAYPLTRAIFRLYNDSYS